MNDRALYRSIATALTKAAHPHGFAILIFDAGEVLYASNGERPDVAKMLGEWTDRARRKTAERTTRAVETRRAKRTRTALETKCAAIGRALAAEAQVILFLFETGAPPTNLAYFTNRPHAEQDLAPWQRTLTAPPSTSTVTKH